MAETKRTAMEALYEDCTTEELERLSRLTALPRDEFFDAKRRQADDLTFDDVRVATGPSNVDEKFVDLTSRFSRNIEVKVPFISAAMDTVTEHKMAIAMARLGGLGVIHSGLPAEEQKEEVRRVKYAQSGLIEFPVTVTPERTLQSVLNEKDERGLPFDTFPVVVAGENRLVGILTRDSFEYMETFGAEVARAMVPRDKIVTAPTGTTITDAHEIMSDHRISMLPVVEPETDMLKGLFLWKDVNSLVKGDGSSHNLDGRRRLRTAMAVPSDKSALERVARAKGDENFIDVVVIDTSKGDGLYGVPTLQMLKKEFPDIDVVVGNVSEPEGALMLAKAGADGIKVGQGPGSICTTRLEIGIGAPQVTAIYNCAEAVRGMDVPICADGGITNYGDLNVAIAAGASTIMMGGMFAATKEAAGRRSRINGVEVKEYRGMGSRSAIVDRSDVRGYGSTGEVVIVPEGVDKQLILSGSVETVFLQAKLALRRGIAAGRSPSVSYHREHATFRFHTPAAQQESQPHPVEASS